MKLTKSETATLKWLLKEAQGNRGLYTGGSQEASFDAYIGHAKEIVKRITSRKKGPKS